VLLAKEGDEHRIIFYRDNITVILSSIQMTCALKTPFRLQSGPGGGETAIPATQNNLDICNATKILERLHKECTEKYVTADASVKGNPTFYLRTQPTIASFPAASGTGTETTGSSINRLYNILIASKTGADQIYRTAVHAITYGIYDPAISQSAFLTPPTGDVASPTNLDTSDNFKGIYGLNKLNKLLETKIDDTIKRMNPGTETVIDDNEAIIGKYIDRQGIKNTLEEIARRENEIYREKFLNIILIMVGLFLVSTQLVRKYFSSGGGGGGGGGGFGSSGLFTGFGLGSGSGLFSRFGGLGLGRSGRSRLTSMFSNNPYSLSTR